MPAKKSEITSTQVTTIKYVDGPQYAASYCNNIAFSVNATDLALIFGEVIDVVGQEAIVERRARITFSPPQAKVLQWILAEQIRQFEENTGAPIVVPPALEATRLGLEAARLVAGQVKS